MTAPEPSPAEQQTIDRSGIFDEERVVEEVARAIAAAEGSRSWEEFDEYDRTEYRRLAAAAVAAYRAQADR